MRSSNVVGGDAESGADAGVATGSLIVDWAGGMAVCVGSTVVAACTGSSFLSGGKKNFCTIKKANTNKTKMPNSNKRPLCRVILFALFNVSEGLPMPAIAGICDGDDLFSTGGGGDDCALAGAFDIDASLANNVGLYQSKFLT